MSASSSKKVKKITLNLPEATLNKLDAIARNTLLRSRNAVIESMVDEVLEVRATLVKVEQDMKSINFKDQSNAWAAVLNISMAVNDISRRLSKFDDKASR